MTSSRNPLQTLPGVRRLDPLDRTVLALTLAVWAMHYVMRTMLSLMPGDTMMPSGYDDMMMGPQTRGRRGRGSGGSSSGMP